MNESMAYKLSNKRLFKNFFSIIISMFFYLIIRLPICFSAYYLFSNSGKLSEVYIAGIGAAILLYYIFFVAPFKFSFAYALQDCANNENYSIAKSLSLSSYSNKLANLFKYYFRLLRWILFLILFCSVLYLALFVLDFKTLYSAINKVNSVLFKNLIGLYEFFVLLFFIATIFCVLYAYGIMRNNMYKHYRYYCPSKLEVSYKDFIKGRKFKQFLLSLVLTLLPVAPLLVYFNQSINNISNGINDLMELLPALKTINFLDDVVIISIAVYFILLPIRRILTASLAYDCYVRKNATR